MKNKVLVAGRNYVSNICMARSLASAGYDVEILRVFQKKPTWKNVLGSMKSESNSKYVKKHAICVTNGEMEPIVEQLKKMAVQNEKTLLIPNDDLVASVVDLHYDELSKLFLISNIEGKQGKISELMNKDTQKWLAQEAGLPVVNCCVLKIGQINKEILKEITYPCFIKPNASKNCTKRVMRKCVNEQELCGTLKELSETPDLEVLVEDYIEIAKEYSLLGVSTKDCVYSPGVFVTEEGGHDEWKGVAMIGRILPCEKMQPLLGQINTFVASLGYEGLFDVDLIESNSGEVYFTEINLRFGGSGYSVTGSGVNLPGMFADYMLKGIPIDTSQKVTDGKRFVNEKIMLDEYGKGYLSYRGVKNRMRKADIYFIKDKNDPFAYRCIKVYYLLAGIKRLVKGMLKQVKR